jgi:hypothetical protein
MNNDPETPRTVDAGAPKRHRGDERAAEPSRPSREELDERDERVRVTRKPMGPTKKERERDEQPPEAAGSPADTPPTSPPEF